MAVNTTPNLSLKKPTDAETVAAWLSSHNDNADALDAAIAQLQPIKVTNANPVWAADSTYQDFGYRGTITVSGCTATMRPEVVFGNAEALSGNYAAVCESGTDCVYIYAKVNTAITIPLVVVHKV